MWYCCSFHVTGCCSLLFCRVFCVPFLLLLYFAFAASLFFVFVLLPNTQCFLWLMHVLKLCTSTHIKHTSILHSILYMRTFVRRVQSTFFICVFSSFFSKKSNSYMKISAQQNVIQLRNDDVHRFMFYSVYSENEKSKFLFFHSLSSFSWFFVYLLFVWHCSSSFIAANVDGIH